jgi:hypothetical protein
LYRSVEDMVQDPRIELVIVNTPVQTHVQHVQMAIMAGKHVICEKPFTVTSAEAAALQVRLGIEIGLGRKVPFDGAILRVFNFV